MKREQYENVAVLDAVDMARMQPTWGVYLAKLDHWLAWWLRQAPVTTVRLIEEDGETRTCTLDAFLTENGVDEEDVRLLLAGETIVLGGGACPPVRVEVVRP